MSRLAQLRAERHLTQLELAVAAEVSLASVQKLESGDDVMPEIARSIGKALAVDWWCLYKDGPNNGSVGAKQPSQRSTKEEK